VLLGRGVGPARSGWRAGEWEGGALGWAGQAVWAEIAFAIFWYFLKAFLFSVFSN